ITSLILITAVVLVACQPAATPFPEEAFVATEAPAETEAPVATELSLPVSTDVPSVPPTDMPPPTDVAKTAPPNESLTANIAALTYENWNEEIHDSSLPVLLFFWESGNDYAVNLIPVVQEIADEYEGRVKVVSIDYSEYSELGPKFTIEQVPTLL